jgi:uncharacterized membrane protein
MGLRASLTPTRVNTYTNPKYQKKTFLCIMNTIHRIWNFYYDGFRSMTLGRTLWAVILVKLFIIFFVLKLFFFPNYIKEHAEKGNEAEFVSQKLAP